MKKSVLFGIIFVVAVIGAVVYTTMSASSTRYRVEVCMEFQGRSRCATAAAATEQNALRTATDNACAVIASGVTETMQCGNTQPVSVRWLAGK